MNWKPIHSTKLDLDAPYLQLTLTVDQAEQISDAIWSLLGEKVQRREYEPLNDLHDVLRAFRCDHLEMTTLMQQLRASLVEGGHLDR